MDSIYDYYSNVKTGNVRWLWYPYIPSGKITVIQGDPGDGKSSCIIDVIARLSRGDFMPDGLSRNAPQTSIYQCAEDGLGDTIKPRLEGAGADCTKVAYIIDKGSSLNLDDNRIESTIIQTGAKLFVIDPLQAFIPPDTEMTNVTRMRAVLRRLADVAEKQDCAIVLIGHMNKRDSGKSLYRGLGSIDIAAIARSILMVARDMDSPEYRYLIPIKSSLSQMGKALTFSFADDGHLLWNDSTSLDRAGIETLLQTDTMKLDYAKRLLLGFVKNHPISASEAMELFQKKGIGERTVRTARKEIGVISYKQGDKWWWKLPDDVSLEEDDSDE